MEGIEKSIEVMLPANLAFTSFINELNEWWPREYTWSGEALVHIQIDRVINGPCTEIGPYGFRCDWGRVTDIKEKERIAFKWQITPERVPQPNPEKSSDVVVAFTATSSNTTAIALQHLNFDKHGNGGAAYREAMNANEGWEYILKLYQTYCHRQKKK